MVLGKYFVDWLAESNIFFRLFSAEDLWHGYSIRIGIRGVFGLGFGVSLWSLLFWAWCYGLTLGYDEALIFLDVPELRPTYLSSIH